MKPAKSKTAGTPAPGAPSLMAELPCLREQPQSVLLQVSVVPNAKRTEVVGLHAGALRVRLAAPPVDGKANDCLTAWVADELGLPKRGVSLLRGASSRIKQLEVSVPLPQVERWVRACLAAAGPGG